MKRLFIFLLILGFSLMFTVSSARADTWARGVTEASGWFDAEKVLPDDDGGPNDDDDLMCWAATAANVLMWSGWQAGYANEDDAFEFFLAEDPVDDGGWMEYAWNFWFDGTQTGVHFSGSSFGGYHTTALYNLAYVEYMDDANVMARTDALLQDGYGVGFGVFGPNVGHAITCWGVDTDDAGNYVGVWVADSDDNKGATGDRRDRPNILRYYEVVWSGSDWFLQDFYGRDTIYIDDIQALAWVPVPGAVLLGLLGLSVAGIKLRKHA